MEQQIRLSLVRVSRAQSADFYMNLFMAPGSRSFVKKITNIIAMVMLLISLR